MSGVDVTQLARRTPGADMTDTGTAIDMVRLRAYRLGRVRQELRKRDYGGALLYDPMNIRYATGSRNMAVYSMHSPARYAFVATEGPVVLFDFYKCEHLSKGIEVIDEVRTAISWFYFSAGPTLEARAKRWADEIADLVDKHCGGNRRIAIDRIDPAGAHFLGERGVRIVEGQEPLEQARVIKSADEIACVNIAISVCEAGMARMREALRPGITENELWSLLHQVNIAQGGEWIETRLLSSGGRTNPWMQECSDRIIRAGELVAFDTDLIGPYGYCADISRTYFCGPGRPTEEQRRLYRYAHEQIEHNVSILKPGLTFGEYSAKTWRIPNEFTANRYVSVAHGVGLCDEYPAIVHPDVLGKRSGYDGLIEPGMTLCVESYIGAEGGTEGVKLEQQVLVTDDGYQLLSTFPMEDALMPA